MGWGHLPPGTPGTFGWQVQQLGVDPFRYALAKAAAPGREGRQARFYLAMAHHRMMRSMALAAGQRGTPPTL